MADGETIPEKEETNNVVLLRAAVNNCFKNIAESVSEEEFMNTMTVLKGNPRLAKKLHKAMVKELYDSMSEDFEDILDQGLKSGLVKVARLTQETSIPPGEIAWRPPGDVNEHMRSLDAHEMKMASDELEERVLKMQAENERLMKIISEKRVQVRNIEKVVDRATKKLPWTIPRLEKTVEQLHDLANSIDAMDLNENEEKIVEKQSDEEEVLKEVEKIDAFEKIVEQELDEEELLKKGEKIVEKELDEEELLKKWEKIDAIEKIVTKEFDAEEVLKRGEKVAEIELNEEELLKKRGKIVEKVLDEEELLKKGEKIDAIEQTE